MSIIERIRASLFATSDLHWRLLILFFTGALITLVMALFRTTSSDIGDFGAGEIARRNVQAPRDFLIEDAISTEERRADAAASVRPVFIYHDAPDQAVGFQLNGLLQTLRTKDGAPRPLTPAARSEFERRFDVNLIGAEWEVLADREGWSHLEAALSKLLDPLLRHGIVANKQVFHNLVRRNGATLVRRTSGQESFIGPQTDFYDLNEAREIFQSAFPPGGFGRGRDFDSLVSKLAGVFLRPNIVLDSERTEAARQAARQAVEPIYYQVKRGEMIVRAHDKITPIQSIKLQKLAELGSSVYEPKTILGHLLLTLFILSAVYLFTLHTWPEFKHSLRDLGLISLTLTVAFSLVQVFAVMGHALSLFFPDLSPNAFVLAAPIAAGGLLLQVTLSTASVFLFTVCFALLTGLYLEQSWEILLLIVIGNMIGVLAVKECPRRSMFIRAGVKVAAANIVIVACFSFIGEQYTMTDYSSRIFCAVLGGITSGVFGAGLTPIVEFLGSYITDIKLLELASLDQPLLRDLSLQAPGTWNHSMVLGQMGESAAEAIGAHSLLTRVGAYYHDIGKAKKPAYFVENQVGAENRHDRLTPSMSALIIRAHVKDGVDMARHHNLPQQIIDFIQQHHGTALIEFFYEKAVKDAGVDEKVDETHYRYPGPKPQTKETGIIMLGDAVEASSRTLTDPTPARIQGLVQKIINKIFISGQLDECELTLRDLHDIAKSFTRVLTGIYHRRIEYSEPAEKRGKITDTAIVRAMTDVAESKVSANGESKKDGRRVAGETNGGEGGMETPSEKTPANGSKEALKRLGLS